MTSLVDRYVYTALRRVPEGQRADIDRELRASIDDAVDARVEAGDTHDAAVQAALRDLGDPDRLADSYAGRAGYLIGPELYPVWRRLLRLLLTIVLPIVVGVTVFVQLLNDPEIGAVIGSVISVILNVGVHMAFWTTLVFVVIERTGHGRTELRTTWTPDDLPQYEPRHMSVTDLAANLVWPVLLIAALVLQQFTFTAEPVLNPANWTFWWPFLIVMVALRGAYSVWIYRSGRSRLTAVVNAALVLLTSGPMVWLLATDRFFNPEYTGFAEIGTGDAKNWITVTVITVIVLTSLWDIADGVIRARRGLPAPVPGTGNTYNFG
ncbi:permease prefix domain 1-containing protein [Paractinoplanes rishiriensis]|uniref:Uncharacterized protein n=1 Tax=Paractinoplanes rishiriensis TaxID=1050105 RepID=A0A919JSM4_9ACTN|nr:permease prefix domain 1-containing protein [Actinoplanes rishiriensis]GIE94426.1 hypothetical protein Ari01nite_18910 [Actinoplanes rishiriensis]